MNLEKVTKGKESILHNLMQFYIYEFSKFVPEIRLEQDGTYKLFNLNRYWENSNFHAFFIKLENEYICFALVESESKSFPNTFHEFFIIATYSGKGYGEKAATELMLMFPGNWIITQIEANYPAQAFWRKLVYKLTNGDVTERYDKERRSIQEFHTSSIVDVAQYFYRNRHFRNNINIA
ncbi:GNAT family N-acetyltransferase [Oceanobacillus iheyensis]|uniref:GNAT family N-acetyltransferase n=1 Tax=Oceanobacillus iheyensis TaxID=182710 RepID=UPI001E3B238E|nr:GNAT family N-acetyltransferase [Oceanobacillus iheyensis]